MRLSLVAAAQVTWWEATCLYQLWCFSGGLCFNKPESACRRVSGFDTYTTDETTGNLGGV